MSLPTQNGQSLMLDRLIVRSPNARFSPIVTGRQVSKCSADGHGSGLEICADRPKAN